MKTQQKLKGKDLINIGIYAAIFCVIVTAIAMFGFIPIMLPMLCVLVPILGGIPYMLFLTKVDKFGMITIFSVIVGLFLWLTGMGYWPTIFGLISGVLTDLIAKSGNYKSSKKDTLGCDVFNITVFGNFVPLFTNIEAYFSTRQSFGKEYISTPNVFSPCLFRKSWRGIECRRHYQRTWRRCETNKSVPDWVLRYGTILLS